MEAVPTLAENRFLPYIEGPPVIQFCPTALQHYRLPIVFERSFDAVIVLFALRNGNNFLLFP